MSSSFAIAKAMVDGKERYCGIDTEDNSLLSPTMYESEEACANGIKKFFKDKVMVQEQKSLEERDEMDMDTMQWHLDEWLSRGPVVQLTTEQLEKAMYTAVADESKVLSEQKMPKMR